MSYGKGIGDAIGFLYLIAIVGVISGISILGYIGYRVYDHFYGSEIIESHNLIVPTIKLHTDGKTIDTTYVYTLNK